MVFRSKKRRKKAHFKVQKWDPLFVIFEKHLYDFNYDSRELFIKGVVDEYFQHLGHQKVTVPPVWRGQMEKALTEEVSDLLVRRLYGCLTVEEFKLKVEETMPEQREEARKRYQKLAG